jgi:hypothetical protein
MLLFKEEFKIGESLRLKTEAKYKVSPNQSN